MFGLTLRYSLLFHLLFIRTNPNIRVYLLGPLMVRIILLVIKLTCLGIHLGTDSAATVEYEDGNGEPYAADRGIFAPLSWTVTVAVVVVTLLTCSPTRRRSATKTIVRPL